MSSSGFYFLIGLIFLEIVAVTQLAIVCTFNWFPKYIFIWFNLNCFYAWRFCIRFDCPGLQLKMQPKDIKIFCQKIQIAANLKRFISGYTTNRHINDVFTLNILFVVNIKYVLWYTHMMLRFYLTDHINSFILLQLKLKEHACLASEQII